MGDAGVEDEYKALESLSDGGCWCPFHFLVGPAGVGKTAVVEELALMIASGKMPEALSDKRVIDSNRRDGHVDQLQLPESCKRTR